jgi:hypothetical protein
MPKHWLSIHIFYYGNQNALLLNGIAPLIEQLREQGLLQRWFFIRYWVEGFHLRLRLLPAPDADPDQVRQLAEASIARYLQEHPAFYQPNEERVSQGKELFLAEYNEEKWAKLYGETGFMPLRPNNTFDSIPYEPEFERYGGSEEALELAQWHFEHSSDTVIHLLREANTNVSSILLGWSVQLMLAYFYALFESDQKVLLTLNLYMTHWKRFHPLASPQEEQFPKKYEQMAPALRQRVSKIRDYMLTVTEPASSRLTSLEKTWKDHLVALRQRIADLYQAKKITVDTSWPKSREEYSLDELLFFLQTSYTHMTNSRLGVLIPQEIYVAYLLKRTLEDLVI